MEKGLSNTFDNFGLTHEISFAYSFTPNLTEDRVMLEDSEEVLAQNDEEKEEPTEENLNDKDEEIAELKRRLTENDAILAELMYRQDSLENNQQKDLEDRFERVMRMVRNETNGKRPDLEERAKEQYFLNNDKTALAQQTVDPKEFNKKTVKDNKPEPVLQKEQTRDAVAQVAVKQEKTKQSQSTSGVKSRKFRNLEGVQDGYYVVANVYKDEHYLNKFVDAMNDEGFPANYINNPSNGLKYVYLKRYNSWQEAENAYRTKMGGNYTGDLWIMNIENRYRNDAYVANTDKIKEKSSKFGTDVLQKNVVAQDNIANNATEEEGYSLSQGMTDYYIIANVFANPKNASRFVKLLNSMGLSAGYFINPQNKYRYVYLKKHNSWNNALVSYYSKINDAYNDKMWIMRVTPNLIA
jgi:hypothetical protein